jgi:hypothetical protein
MRKAVRQGDVLLVPVAKVVGERIEPTRKRYILAEGEQTGHHHSVGANAAAFLSREGLFVEGTDTLVHQEHDPHDIDGPYQVVQQRRATQHYILPVSD